MIRLLRQHWFLLALAATLSLSLLVGGPLLPLAEAFPRRGLIAAILFATALPVDLRASTSTRGFATAVLLATLLSTVAAPILGYAAGRLLPATLGVGLFVAAASPCTMASAAVWTRRGGGNDAVALAVTLITSLACFAVLPFWGWLLLGNAVQVDAGGLAVTLLAFVAAPVGVAQVLRCWPPIARQADRWKPALSLAGQGGVLLLVLLGSVGAGAALRGLSEPIPLTAWLATATLATAVHAVLLTAGWHGARSAGLAPPERVAVAIAGSQKTLAVGVGIATDFGPLALLPMIAYHVAQLVIDTLFADRVRPLGGLDGQGESP